MKTAILLGAGSSLPAGYPSTRCLTDRVLSGNGVKRHTDRTRFVNCMVRRLHAEAERYFSAKSERPANYEDLFYLAEQLSDEVLGQMENPAVYPFFTKLKADMSPLVEAANAENEVPNKTSYPNIRDDFKVLLTKTCNYISKTVSHHLCREPTSTDHLKIFEEACRTGKVTAIATLCHDTHVETHLKEKEGIALADGFSEKEKEGVRYWDGDFSSNSKTPFLKLHGSVDWFRFRPDDSSSYWYDDRIGIGDPYHTRRDDRPQTALDGGRPLLLIGTFNKVADYSQGIFLDLHHRFRSTLREADQLVVCGYSFGDKGINAAVIGWYYEKRGRRLLIIHPDRDELVSNARSAIRNKWDEWEKSDTIDFMASRLEEVDVDEFLRKICSPGKYSVPSMNQRRSR